MRLIDTDDLKERLNELCPPAPGSTVLMADVFRVINEMVQEAERPKRKPAHVIPWSDLKPGHLYWREEFGEDEVTLVSARVPYDRAYRYWDEWPSKELREATLWDEDEDERRPEAWME